MGKVGPMDTVGYTIGVGRGRGGAPTMSEVWIWEEDRWRLDCVADATHRVNWETRVSPNIDVETVKTRKTQHANGFGVVPLYPVTWHTLCVSQKSVGSARQNTLCIYSPVIPSYFGRVMCFDGGMAPYPGHGALHLEMTMHVSASSTANHRARADAATSSITAFPARPARRCVLSATYPRLSQLWKVDSWALCVGTKLSTKILVLSSAGRQSVAGSQ